MKFYYNGQLVRTSKTRNYKYAIVRESGDKIKVYACSETLENASKRLQSEKAYQTQRAEGDLKWGKIPENYKWCVEHYGKYDPEAEYNKRLEMIKDIKIVELETIA